MASKNKKKNMVDKMEDLTNIMRKYIENNNIKTSNDFIDRTSMKPYMDDLYNNKVHINIMKIALENMKIGMNKCVKNKNFDLEESKMLHDSYEYLKILLELLEINLRSNTKMTRQVFRKSIREKMNEMQYMRKSVNTKKMIEFKNVNNNGLMRNAMNTNSVSNINNTSMVELNKNRVNDYVYMYNHSIRTNKKYKKDNKKIKPSLKMIRQQIQSRSIE